jgi:hypothetical protein
MPNAPGRSVVDLTLEQVLEMIVAIARIQGDPGYLEPILQSALDGLRNPTVGDRSRVARRSR